MAAAGIEQRNVAAALGIAGGTLRKHYRAELRAGGALANAAVIAALYRIATSSEDANAAVAAGIWWTKCRLGWSEKHQLSGPNGTPLNPPGQSYVVRMPTPVDSTASTARLDLAPGRRVA